MNILITGSNGYIARNLSRHLGDHNLTLTNRSNLNLLNCVEVNDFFKNKYFDVVIHTATTGGSRLRNDESNVFYENCLMHQNILNNCISFGKYISFGSGAELDRRYNIDFSTDLRTSYPIDPYGMSKNFIAKSGLLIKKFYNVRLFNVFNYDELASRMIKANILNYIEKKPIHIHQDKFMDFFYMDDLSEIVRFIINSNTTQQVINCSYREKYKLSDIANIINNLSDYKVEINLENENMGFSYFGEYNLHLCNVKLCGLQSGIQKTYEHLKAS